MTVSQKENGPLSQKLRSKSGKRVVYIENFCHISGENTLDRVKLHDHLIIHDSKHFFIHLFFKLVLKFKLYE